MAQFATPLPNMIRVNLLKDGPDDFGVGKVENLRWWLLVICFCNTNGLYIYFVALSFSITFISKFVTIIPSFCPSLTLGNQGRSQDFSDQRNNTFTGIRNKSKEKGSNSRKKEQKARKKVQHSQSSRLRGGWVESAPPSCCRPCWDFGSLVILFQI